MKSLVDEDGFLYRYPKELFERKPSLAEIDAELRAQIDLAGQKGVQVQYLDTHYVELTDYPGLDGLIRKIAADDRVPLSGTPTSSSTAAWAAGAPRSST